MEDNHTLLSDLPLIAILRGLTQEDALSVGDVLIEAGFIHLEVPIDTVESLASLEVLASRFGNDATIGAGTVIKYDQVAKVANAGGKYIVSPNTDSEIIASTKSHGMLSVPGFFTPSEALLALEAGADALKCFPAQLMSPEGLAAILAILPKDVPVFMVGGIDEAAFKRYFGKGAYGFGIGSSLYKSGRNIQELKKRAQSLIGAFQASHKT